MVSLVKSVSTEAMYDTETLSYNDLKIANARRFCTLYFRMRFENPKLWSEDICKQIGFLPRTMTKSKQMIGAPTRHLSKTAEQLQQAYTKCFVTKIRHAEKKKFMVKLARKGLSPDDTQKYIDAWDREHANIGSTPVSLTASKARQKQQRR